MMKLLFIISGLFSCSSFFVAAEGNERVGESVDYGEQFNTIVLDEIVIVAGEDN